MPASLSKKGESLHELIRRGETEALARRLLPTARRFARKILLGAEDHLVASAAHDAVLAACRYAHTYRGDSSLTSWLFTITRRAALALVERERRFSLHFSLSDPLDLPEGIPAAPACLSRREALETLERLVPNRAWRRIWLDWNDPSRRPTHAEVARRHGYTSASVEVILSRVRRRLRLQQSVFHDPRSAGGEKAALTR